MRRRFIIDLAAAATQVPVPLAKVPEKLAAFDELPLPELISQLERDAKRTFTPQQRGEWDSYLTSETNQLAGVKRQLKDETQELKLARL